MVTDVSREAQQTTNKGPFVSVTPNANRSRGLFFFSLSNHNSK
jgi:hypothetical protein